MNSERVAGAKGAISPSPSPGEKRPHSASRMVAIIRELTRQSRSQKEDAIIATEEEALEIFWNTYKEERCFSSHSSNLLFLELLYLLATVRTTSWLKTTSCNEHRLHVLRCLRLLLRDDAHQAKVMEMQGVLSALSETCKELVKAYFYTDNAVAVEALTQLTNIYQKLSNNVCYHSALLKEDVHHSLVQLLSCRDLVILHCSLNALTNLCKEHESRLAVCQLDCTERLLFHLQYSSSETKLLASDLLLLLSQELEIRQQMTDLDALGLCLRLLQSKDTRLLQRLVKILDSLAEDDVSQEAIRLRGGIPLLLSLLKGQNESNQDKTKDGDDDIVLSLKAACCSAIAQLILNDSCAQIVVKSNGLYLLSVQLFPTSSTTQHSSPAYRDNLCMHALRALRFLFSLERNRKLFKTLLPEKIFEAFINIGNYVKPLKNYEALMKTITSLPFDEQKKIQSNIEDLNKNQIPTRIIGGYDVYELLGKGAYGQVYRVMKQQSESCYAMKEIKSDDSVLGGSFDKKSENIGKIMNEVSIMKEQLKHPNIVRYYKCFHEGDSLFIVMELLEGAPLIDHIVVCREKGESFPELRIWKLFSQLIHGLRYLHKEKKIVHRDLKPDNIMVADKDKLIIMDFGLAKQKDKEFSVLKSTVGTILYWCPELVNNEPYNEKADIWAAGCILYQMAMLQPPFQSGNPLGLARKIAELDYPHIQSGAYSDKVTQVIERCLTANPICRPDSVEVGAMICEIIMKQMDNLTVENTFLHKQLAREKNRASKYTSRSTHFLQQLDGSVIYSKDAGGQNLSIIATPSHTRVSTPRALSATRSVAPQKQMESSPPISRTRSNSVTSILSVSSQQLREIADPISQLMSQVHKLHYICQLPPTLHCSMRRTVVERFQRHLFVSGSGALSLKAEMHKLITGSEEVIDFFVQQNLSVLSNKALAELSGSLQSKGKPSLGEDHLITYDDLQAIVESLLTETGYYQDGGIKT